MCFHTKSFFFLNRGEIEEKNIHKIMESEDCGKLCIRCCSSSVEDRVGTINQKELKWLAEQILILNRNKRKGFGLLLS